MGEIWLRAATAQDQQAIRRIIWAAQLNPLALHWPRFVVAESQGQVVGVGQVKVHADGAPELASLAVLPQLQGSGAGTPAMMRRSTASASNPSISASGRRMMRWR